MLRYSGIPCVTVRGIAKSMDYKVGQPLVQKDEPLFHPETGALPSQIASLQHSWNAAYVDGTWRLYDCTWAAQRLAMGARKGLPKTSEAITQQYETDMFYYQADPSKLITTHYPFEDDWQLIDPPISIVVNFPFLLDSKATFVNKQIISTFRTGTRNCVSILTKFRIFLVLSRWKYRQDRMRNLLRCASEVVAHYAIRC